jgi:phosphatidylglycerophosphatase A
MDVPNHGAEMSNVNYRKFAVETMIDAAKLLITLASGFLVLSVTLLKHLSSTPSDPIHHFWLMILCWIALIVSIACGVLSLGAVATSAHDHEKFDVDELMTKWLLRGQQVLFVCAFVFFVIYAVVNK